MNPSQKNHRRTAKIVVQKHLILETLVRDSGTIFKKKAVYAECANTSNGRFVRNLGVAAREKHFAVGGRSFSVKMSNAWEEKKGEALQPVEGRKSRKGSGEVANRLCRGASNFFRGPMKRRGGMSKNLKNYPSSHGRREDELLKNHGILRRGGQEARTPSFQTVFWHKFSIEK